MNPHLRLIDAAVSRAFETAITDTSDVSGWLAMVECYGNTYTLIVRDGVLEVRDCEPDDPDFNPEEAPILKRYAIVLKEVG